MCTYTYCHCGGIDNIQHFIFSCQPVCTFWENLLKWWNNLNIQYIKTLKEQDIIFGLSPDPTNGVLNFILILAKKHVYDCKMIDKPVSIISFLPLLKENIVVEEKIYSKNFKHEYFVEKWGPLSNAL